MEQRKSNTRLCVMNQRKVIDSSCLEQQTVYQSVSKRNVKVKVKIIVTVLYPCASPGSYYHALCRARPLFLFYLHVIVIRTWGSYLGLFVYKIVGVVCRRHP